MKNKGYTLIEMLIVLAIIAILSGMSFASIGIIKKAQCSAAANNLNDYMAATLTKTKALQNNEKSVKDGDYCLMVAYMDASEPADGKEEYCYYLTRAKSISDAWQDKSVCDQKSTCAHGISIFYSADGTSYSLIDKESPIMIKFKKSDGQVLNGAGYYKFVIGNDENENVQAIVYLDKATGNHYVK